MPTDRHAVSAKDVKPLEGKLPAEFGGWEYLIVVNKEGRTFYLTKDDCTVEDSEKEDTVWTEVNNALVGDSKNEYHYIRIRTMKGEGIIRHEAEDSGCYPPIGGRPQCPTHKIVIPVQYRSATAKIDAALAKHQLPSDQLAQVKKLRAQGETLQKAGNYADSLKMLGEAEAILAVE